MPERLKIPGGYRLDIAGAPAPDIEDAPRPEQLLVSLTERGVRYACDVRPGDRVARGDALAHAVFRGLTLVLPTPACATVIGVEDDGAAVRLTVEGDADTSALSAPEHGGEFAVMRDAIARAGLWPIFTSTATGDMPVGARPPALVAVRAASVEPFRAQPALVALNAWEDFLGGLDCLRALAGEDAPICLVAATEENANRQLARRFLDSRLHEMAQLYETPFRCGADSELVLARALRKRAGIAGEAWTANAAGVAALGAFYARGETSSRVVVSVAGPAEARPRHVRALVGTPLSDLLGRIDPETRVVRGGLLRGDAVDPGAASVGYDDDGFTLLADVSPRRLFGFARLRSERRSWTRSFIGPRGHGSPTTSLHGEPRPCVACGECETVCPAGVFPQIIHRMLWR